MRRVSPFQLSESFISVMLRTSRKPLPIAVSTLRVPVPVPALSAQSRLPPTIGMVPVPLRPAKANEERPPCATMDFQNVKRLIFSESPLMRLRRRR